MSKLKEVFIKKEYNTFDDLKDINTVFFPLNIVEDYIIFKKFDTISQETEIMAMKKEETKKLYSMEEFLKTSIKIEKSGFYKGMLEFEKKLYESLIVCYVNDYNELSYDTTSDTFIINISVYNKENFIPFKEQPNISFSNIDNFIGKKEKKKV